MHKLNLNQEAEEMKAAVDKDAAETAVDDSTAMGNNQTSEQAVNTRGKSMKKSFPKSKILMVFLAILLGVGTGFGVNKLTAGGSTGSVNSEDIQRHPGASISNGDIFGSADENTFPDNAQGYLEIGGIDGEGSHSLLRAGGDSQTVYMTSSVVDLDEFSGMEVRVWGETFKGQKAGWLMDVGRVEVVDTEGTAPSEE